MKTIIFTFMFIFLTKVTMAQFIISIQKTDGSKPIEFQTSLLSQIVFYPSCPGLSTVDYLGKTYNTVLIGGQCWFKENLDVGTFITVNVTQSNNGILEKYCYNDEPDSCDVYGGFYMWDEALQYAVPPEGAQGICPEGWHIPTELDIGILINTAVVGLDGNTLKAIWQGTGGGAGTNTSGFSALLAGYCYGGFTGSFFDFGKSSILTSTELNQGNNYWSVGLNSTNSTITLNGFLKLVTGNVRCIKD